MASFEELTARRRQIAELRAPPYCLPMQQIASKLGVSVGTVHADLKTASLFGYNVNSHTITDKRGRVMPARYTRRKRKRSTNW